MLGLPYSFGLDDQIKSYRVHPAKGGGLSHRD
jgi:hypothetical protein